jgi:hypothetical protein
MDNPIEYQNNLLRYYLHINSPDELSDDTWTMCLAQLEDIRKKEAQAGKK